MTPKVCEEPDCGRKIHGKGLCGKHYLRSWSANRRDPNQKERVTPGASLAERLETHGWSVVPHEGRGIVTTPCWEWQSAVDSKGYGTLASGKCRNGDPKQSIPIPAHRAAYLAWVGPIPDGQLVRHRCDNPPCIKPGHLELGTIPDNVRDAVERKLLPNGEHSSLHKLTDEQVVEIRSRYAQGGISQRALAAEYGVCQQLISHYMRGTRRAEKTGHQQWHQSA